MGTKSTHLDVLWDYHQHFQGTPAPCSNFGYIEYSNSIGNGSYHGLEASVKCHRDFAGGPIESLFPLLQVVCLSTSLRWAWLQGNSRARQLRSPVPALAGFGFHCRLPAAPFERHKQSALDPPKICFARLESGLLRTGSPQRIGDERKTKICFARIASLS